MKEGLIQVLGQVEAQTDIVSWLPIVECQEVYSTLLQNC